MDLSGLRAVIIEAVAEDMSMIGDMSDTTEDLVIEWNKVCKASPTVGIPAPIDPDNLDAASED